MRNKYTQLQNLNIYMRDKTLVIEYRNPKDFFWTWTYDFKYPSNQQEQPLYLIDALKLFYESIQERLEKEKNDKNRSISEETIKENNTSYLVEYLNAKGFDIANLDITNYD